MEDWKVILSNEDAKSIGPGLIEAATEDRKKKFGKLVMEQVQELMSQKAQTLNYIEKANSEIAMYNRRLDAIKAGEFSVGFDGRINYSEKELN